MGITYFLSRWYTLGTIRGLKKHKTSEKPVNKFFSEVLISLYFYSLTIVSSAFKHLKKIIGISYFSLISLHKEIPLPSGN